MSIFGKHEKTAQQQVTNGRFEIEHNGEIAYLEYAFSGKVLELIHTEVPESMRGHGVASELAQSSLEWARENRVRVDVICPLVREYIGKHPEYSDLLIH